MQLTILASCPSLQRPGWAKKKFDCCQGVCSGERYVSTSGREYRGTRSMCQHEYARIGASRMNVQPEKVGHVVEVPIGHEDKVIVL
jgi:hypothetical protein